MSKRWMPCLAPAALALLAAGVHAQGTPVRIAGVPLGSGVPVAVGTPADGLADQIAEGVFHAPNYLPGHPTAATLWPRVVHVPCRRHEASSDLICAGYGVSPLRGEYIYLRPFIESIPQPPPAQPPVPKKPLE